MARHLLIGNGGAATITNGLVPDTGIVFQDEGGAAFHATTETVITSPSFRVLQGTAGANIASPWIKGKNIISVTGKLFEDAVANTSTVTAATNSTSGGTVSLKFVRKGGTHAQFFHMSVGISAAVTTADNLGIAIFNEYNSLVKPDWLAAACTEANGVVTFSGSVPSATWEEGLVDFMVIVEENTFGASTFTAANNVATAKAGSGVGWEVRRLEKELHGVQHGFYDRLKMPNEPALAAVGSSSYSVITIVATKDGSTTSAINGVDNLIEINIAMLDDAKLETLQTAINAYFTSIDFATIDVTA